MKKGYNKHIKTITQMLLFVLALKEKLNGKKKYDKAGQNKVSKLIKNLVYIGQGSQFINCTGCPKKMLPRGSPAPLTSSPALIRTFFFYQDSIKGLVPC